MSQDEHTIVRPNIYQNQIEINILDTLNEPIVINELNQLSEPGENYIWLNNIDVEDWSENLFSAEKYSNLESEWLGKSDIKGFLEDPVDSDYSCSVHSKPKKNFQTNNGQSDEQDHHPKPFDPDDGPIVVNQSPNIEVPPAPPIIIRQVPNEPKQSEILKIFELPPLPPKVPETKVVTILGKQLPPPPRRVICERLPELPRKPQDIHIERWLPLKDKKRKVILKQKQADPHCKCKVRNIIVSWEKRKCSNNIKNVIRRLGVERTDPIDYVKSYGTSLVSSDAFPELVNEIIKEEDVPVASESEVKYYTTLEGDIHGMVLIDDLEKEGLGDLKDLIKNLIVDNSSKKKSKTSTNNELPELDHKVNKTKLERNK